MTPIAAMEQALLSEIKSIEQRLRAAKIPMKDVFLLSGVERTTWHRWRELSRRPRNRTWARLTAAVDKLAPPRRTTRAKR